MATHLPLELFRELIPELRRRGYEVIGPRARDNAIQFDPIESADDLPSGWTTEQEPARLRLKRREDDAFFGYANTAQSLKRFLHPPDICMSATVREDGTFRILEHSPSPPCYAFIGVRACDLAAMERLDRVLQNDKYKDTVYEGRRAQAFLVAVECTECASTCFCASMGTGPVPHGGYDIALTEHTDSTAGHWFSANAGTAAGAEVLAALGAGEEIVEPAEPFRAIQKRHIDTAGLREALYDNFDNPRWEETAARCLACGNCTMACPTCFCITVEDTSDVAQQRAERWRRWDSCFTQSFSYIHGGSVRLSPKARYRQWLTHKLAAWVDQFGSFGCVGCGRCITWCPAGIDITEEAAALRG